MKKYEWIPEEKHTCTHRECDLCGRKAEDGKNWSKEQHKVEKTKVKCHVGHEWPDDADTEVAYDIDVCPKCFIKKLVPWINSQREGKKPITHRKHWEPDE